MDTFLEIIEVICNVLTIIILLRVIVSWWVRNPQGIFYRILCRITDPILAPIRRIIPRLGPFDFSPLVAVVLLQLVASLRYFLP